MFLSFFLLRLFFDIIAEYITMLWYDVVCCILIKITYLWNMRWRAPDQEVDQRGRGERLCIKDCQVK